MKGRYVEVAVGLPVRGTFSYEVPASFPPVDVGSRVLVPFGRRGVTGVVVAAADEPPEGIDTKPVREVLDAKPVISSELLRLCLWVAEYYESPPGEALRLALPSGTEESSRTRLALTDRGQASLAGQGAALSPTVREQLMLLGAGRKLRDARGIEAIVEAGLAAWQEQRRGARVKARKVRRLTLVQGVDETVAQLSRAPRQQEVARALGAAGGSILRSELSGSAAVVRAMVKAGLVTESSEEIVRNPWSAEPVPDAPPELTSEQQAAFAKIDASLRAGEYRAFVLHGITGSGKTEVYLRVIARALAAGKTALVLVPEIALTPQLALRFRARFGDQVAVLHSGLSAGERLDQWRRLQAGKASIALGVRSAVFAPLEGLGVLVVDEEHDGSFKQEEGVRYHARDVALMRARRLGAVCILGSATPSFESYAHARAGRHTLVTLTERPTPRPLPEVHVVDLRKFQPDPESFLTAPLARAIEDNLHRGQQSILFLNRRGFSTFTVCVACGVSRQCPDCSVSLTYHLGVDRLRCHYCGHAETAPRRCPECQGEGTLQRLGLGTEKVENGLRQRFEGARIARLDRDTARGGGLERVLGMMNARQVDVLIGTQMVTKGHDFPGVTLVGVLSADTGLALPDFRAGERTFQLLAQVAGRAGRGVDAGQVLVQTYAPDHPVIRAATSHDYLSFFRLEEQQRRELGYPPHGHVVAVRLDGKNEAAVAGAAAALRDRGKQASSDKTATGVQLLGPAEAPLRRLKGRHRWHLWVKAPERVRLRHFVRALVADFEPPGVRLTVDIDPLSAL